MKKNPLIYVFAGFVLAITIFDIAKPDKTFSDLENRMLASKPKFTAKGYFENTFGPKYETYINDQFIFRDQWIDLKSTTEFALGKLENNNIIFGKDKYLFDKFDTMEKEKQEKNIEAINIFKEKINANLVTMIAPNSYEIYRENLYKGLNMINQRVETEKVYGSLESRNINLFNVFDENKDKYIYYKTDHHWTTEGAYLAYCEFVKLKGIEPMDLNYFESKKVEGFLGTFFSKGKPFKSEYDTITYYEIPNLEVTIGEKKFNSLYDYEKISERDKYGMFLRGNNPLTIIKNNSLSNGKKILIIKDSYANSFIPFLTFNYEEIHVIDLRSFLSGVAEYTNENDIDDVLILYNFTNFNTDNNILKLKY